GLRDRRRGDQGDPADRRHASVPLLRRLVDPRELRAARAAAPGLRPCQETGVNAPIIRLFGLVVVLFAVLVAFTSRWAVFDSKSLNDNALNKRGVLEAARIKRGVIKAADGTVVARSLKQPGRVYERTHPTGDLF